MLGSVSLASGKDHWQALAMILISHHCDLCVERGWEGGQQMYPEASQELQLAGFMLISYSGRYRRVQRSLDLWLMWLAGERGPHLKC